MNRVIVAAILLSGPLQAQGVEWDALTLNRIMVLTKDNRSEFVACITGYVVDDSTVATTPEDFFIPFHERSTATGAKTQPCPDNTAVVFHNHPMHGRPESMDFLCDLSALDLANIANTTAPAVAIGVSNGRRFMVCSWLTARLRGNTG